MTSEPAQHVHEQRDRAESFGALAADYDRWRPTYPDALITEIAARGTDVLDVGCGTGKAAALMAAAGLNVLGVEIDPAMAAIARGHGIPVEVASFETWDDDGRRFDVLTAAQAWHWVEPVEGAAKAMRVLRPGGSLALFWNVSTFEPEIDDRLHAVYDEYLPEESKKQHGGVRGRVDLYGEPFADAGFVDLEQREFPWTHSYSADEFTAMISTHSDVSLLPDADRAALLVDMRAMIDDELDGALPIKWETHTLFGRTVAR